MNLPAQQRSAVLDYFGRLTAERSRQTIESGAPKDAGGPSTDKDDAPLHRAIAKLNAGEKLDASEEFALEAIIRVQRPIIPIENDQVNVEGLAESWAGLLAAQANTLSRVARAVGGLTLSGLPSLGHIGTCFLVGDQLAATARHVVERFAVREEAGRYRFMPGITLSADFELNRTVAVTEVVLVHPVLDFALLRLDIAGPDTGGGLAIDGNPDIPIGRSVCVVGFPSLTSPVFGEKAGAKRLAPGMIVDVTHYQGYGAPVLAITHDCSTVLGMSGAPLVDMETGEVLGIQFAGAAGTLNYAIPASELARDLRVRSNVAFAQGSVRTDPLAWNEEWHTFTGQGPSAPSTPLKTSRVIASVQEIDHFLAREFSSSERLVAFLQGLGPTYADVVAAQPGRTRSDFAAYRAALVTTLQRRGLIDEKFLDSIGFKVEREAETAKTPAEDDPRRALPAGAMRALRGGPLAGVLTRNAERLVGNIRSRFEKPEPRPSYVPGPDDIVGIDYLTRGLEAARAVGYVTLGAQPMKGASCWLIASDLVVTVAHIYDFAGRAGDGIGGPPPLDPAAFTVFFKDQDGASATVKVAEVAFVDFTLDIMLLRTQQPVVGRSPLQIRVEPMSAGGITSIHHAYLGPKRISALGGTMLANDGQQATYLLASAPGATGAPVFDREWRVVATHSARIKHRIAGLEAPIEARIGTTSPAMIDAVRQAATGERVWRRIAAAQRSLRSIDVDLTNIERWPVGTRSRPVVIELVDEETPLPAIEGLTVTARTGRIASAVVTAAAISKLAETAGVISVEASRAAGQSECVRSVPYIGAPIVHGQYGEIGDMALIALIDTGIDVRHAAFRDEGGRSRIVAFWDQRDPRSSAAQPTATISAEARAMAERFGLHGGALYVREDIEKMIAGAPAPATFPAALDSAHGTFVASIAAGRRTGNNANDFPGGVAPGAQVVAVRYDLDGESVGNSNGHVQALGFIDALARTLDLPVVVNISNGMNSGAHDGSSKVEVACGEFTRQGQKPGRVVVKSAGNELNMARHATFTVGQGFTKALRWRSTPIPDAVNPASLIERIELWFPRSNRYKFQVRTPQGRRCSAISTEFRTLDEFLPNGNRLGARYSLMRSENAQSLLELSITKGKSAAVESGEWALLINAVERPTPEPIHAWIEVISNRDIRFLDDPDNSCTITIPGTSEHVITVGAVEPTTNPYPFENGSRGPTITKLQKPELVAPGVQIRAAQAGTVTHVADKACRGTSFSAPHVAGVLALVMSARKKKEPGGATMFNSIILAANLIDQLKNFTHEPDSQTGYGSLDAVAFFEVMDKQD